MPCRFTLEHLRLRLAICVRSISATEKVDQYPILAAHVTTCTDSQPGHQGTLLISVQERLGTRTNHLHIQTVKLTQI